MLKIEFCRKRQKRLVEILQQRKLDAAVIGWPKHVLYFSRILPHWISQSGFLLLADGRSCLIANQGSAEGPAADELIEYQAAWDYTFRPNQPMLVAEQALAWLKSHRCARVGVDASMVGSALGLGWNGAEKPADIEPDLWQLRRCKDPDELELMSGAIRCAQAMYKRARQIIRPGITELEVYAQLQQAAVMEAGEPLSDPLGNDYACNAMGGQPRVGRAAEAGELYILDLGPAYRGYFSDTCRTISVDGRLTDAQHKAWEGVMGGMKLIESMARPGVRCRAIVQAVQEYYQRTFNSPLIHHVGHGVGLWAHEFPHVDAIWDDELLQGEVVSIEPGIYGPELKAGMRIENSYLITADGVRNLVDAPMELA